MSDSEKKMNILIEEANANYKANRYKDAARTFEHLITLAIQSEELEEAIYFAYRAADCWRKNKNGVEGVGEEIVDSRLGCSILTDLIRVNNFCLF